MVRDVSNLCLGNFTNTWCGRGWDNSKIYVYQQRDHASTNKRSNKESKLNKVTKAEEMITRPLAVLQQKDQRRDTRPLAVLQSMPLLPRMCIEPSNMLPLSLATTTTSSKHALSVLVPLLELQTVDKRR